MWDSAAEGRPGADTPCCSLHSVGSGLLSAATHRPINVAVTQQTGKVLRQNLLGVLGIFLVYFGIIKSRDIDYLFILFFIQLNEKLISSFLFLSSCALPSDPRLANYCCSSPTKANLPILKTLNEMTHLFNLPNMEP